MGLFDFFFGSNKATNKERVRSVTSSRKAISFCGNLIEIPSLDFFGEFRISRSGEWIICWTDSDEQNRRGGQRAGGHGRYILYHAPQDKFAVQGRAERPNSGSVADNGNFSIEDWHFGSGLSGTFYVFSSAGCELVKRRFQANLYNSAISDSGRFAVCQTAGSPTGEDGNRLTAFDVDRNAELFSVHPPTGWADSYTFREDVPQFGVVIKKIGTFYYDIQGNLIDPEKFDVARLHCDRYDVVLLAAKEICESPYFNDERAKDVLAACTKALALGAERDQGWKAVALKVQGVAHEHLGNYDAAIAAFDGALRINPKIGVKRKSDSLKKKLARNE